MRYKNWVALFSQTGSEIVDLSTKLSRKPDFVITNANLDNVNPNIEVDFRINNDEAKTLDILEDIEFDKRDTLITLNGWLRIVPPDKCKMYNIYNGHPGLITKYPELKGKDPQKRAWENIASYAKIGSVVHKVVAEVDAGEVIVEKSARTRDVLNINRTYDTLRKTSFDAWIEFFKEHL